MSDACTVKEDVERKEEIESSAHESESAERDDKEKIVEETAAETVSTEENLKETVDTKGPDAEGGNGPHVILTPNRRIRIPPFLRTNACQGQERWLR
jgi:hypothetical protein